MTSIRNLADGWVDAAVLLIPELVPFLMQSQVSSLRQLLLNSQTSRLSDSFQADARNFEVKEGIVYSPRHFLHKHLKVSLSLKLDKVLIIS